MTSRKRDVLEKKMLPVRFQLEVDVESRISSGNAAELWSDFNSQLSNWILEKVPAPQGQLEGWAQDSSSGGFQVGKQRIRWQNEGLPDGSCRDCFLDWRVGTPAVSVLEVRVGQLEERLTFRVIRKGRIVRRQQKWDLLERLTSQFALGADGRRLGVWDVQQDGRDLQAFISRRDRRLPVVVLSQPTKPECVPAAVQADLLGMAHVVSCSVEAGRSLSHPCYGGAARILWPWDERPEFFLCPDRNRIRAAVLKESRGAGPGDLFRKVQLRLGEHKAGILSSKERERALIESWDAESKLKEENDKLLQENSALKHRLREKIAKTRREMNEEDSEGAFDDGSNPGALPSDLRPAELATVLQSLGF
ncbi:MAG TPA: hypothetical protein VN515_02770 [Terriglobales bacterium]|nr:hypothetical protein [Terriglobales bacterium]